MELITPQLTIGLLLISIGIVSKFDNKFDVKFDFLKAFRFLLLGAHHHIHIYSREIQSNHSLKDSSQALTKYWLRMLTGVHSK